MYKHDVISINRYQAFPETALEKNGPNGAVWLQRHEWQIPEMPGRLFLVLIVVLVLVIGK